MRSRHRDWRTLRAPVLGGTLAALVALAACSGFIDYDPMKSISVKDVRALELVYKDEPLDCLYTRIREKNVLVEDQHEVTSLSCDFAAHHAAYGVEPTEYGEPTWIASNGKELPCITLAAGVDCDWELAKGKP
ncbi:hypothetical protein [Nocardioides sp. AE5]|uniref:hypothetical protein n=1 Tax=Nocardioides sp. AE5 TaxID=2962573 RepID=UPI002880F502|nr:hypothetical protein [Nocardioides sp. AE5]MDT0202225.1 hypothetical protein [Nocardioides sp. AE5]